MALAEWIVLVVKIWLTIGFVRQPLVCRLGDRSRRSFGPRSLCVQAAARAGRHAAVAVRYPSLATPATNPRLRETLMLRAHRRAHRLIWTAIAIIVPCVLVLGFLARPIARFPQPQRLAPPPEETAMSVRYAPVGWNANKYIYDAMLAFAVIGYLATFNPPVAQSPGPLPPDDDATIRMPPARTASAPS